MLSSILMFILIFKIINQFIQLNKLYYINIKFQQLLNL